ncbi:hypothetical protein ACFL24_01630 [Patescibacteria group bacterium]
MCTCQIDGVEAITTSGATIAWLLEIEAAKKFNAWVKRNEDKKVLRINIDRVPGKNTQQIIYRIEYQLAKDS